MRPASQNLMKISLIINKAKETYVAYLLGRHKKWILHSVVNSFVDLTDNYNLDFVSHETMSGKKN